MVIGCNLVVFTLRQPACMAIVFVCQAAMYREIVSVAYAYEKERQLPGFRGFYYYWYVVALFVFYGRTLHPYLLAQSFEDVIGFKASELYPIKHYTFVAFTLYIAGIVAFVVSLQKRKLYKYVDVEVKMGEKRRGGERWI